MKLRSVLQNSTLEMLYFFPLIILVVTMVIFCLSAFRGFEITDESFYFLHYLYSREFFAGASFFGLYFELPFYWLNGNIPAIRILGLFILVFSALYFILKLYAYFFSDFILKENKIAFVSTGVTFSLFYHSYLQGLRAPSYNLLVLICILISTGALFAILEQLKTDKKYSFAPLLYGFTISICTFTKASSSLFLVISHFLFCLFMYSHWSIRHLKYIAVFSLLGFVINVMLIQLFFPDWLQVLMRGVQSTYLLDGRSLLNAPREFSWDIQRSFLSSWWVYLLISVFYLLSLLTAIYYKSKKISALILFLVFTLVLWIVIRTDPATLYPIMFVVITLLFITNIFTNNEKNDRRLVALIILFLVLPFGYSWGTNMPIAGHSNMAFIFPLAACLLILHRLNTKEVIKKWSYLLSLTVFCIPALWFQIAPWFDLEHNYRLHTPLIEQKYPISIGNPASTVFVDAVMRDDITAFLEMSSTAGFVKGSSLFDLTGDSVGLVYAAGGQPVGTAWLLGDYPSSEKVFEYLIDSIDKTRLENAWLITSEDNPRHIKDWKEIWLRKFGKFTHTAVGMRCLHWPYKRSNFLNKDCYEITLWKPATAIHEYHR